MNFCCTLDRNYKSALCWDFTLNLGRLPPYYVIASSFQSTTLLNKAIKKCCLILEPVLICHRKYENAVKLLCDTLLDACPGLLKNAKVLGADVERQTYNALSMQCY